MTQKQFRHQKSHIFFIKTLIFYNNFRTPTEVYTQASTVWRGVYTIVGNHLEQRLAGKLANRNVDLRLGNLKEAFEKTVVKNESRRSGKSRKKTLNRSRQMIIASLKYGEENQRFEKKKSRNLYSDKSHSLNERLSRDEQATCGNWKIVIGHVTRPVAG